MTGATPATGSGALVLPGTRDTAGEPEGLVVVVSKRNLIVEDVQVADLPTSRDEAARAGFDARYKRDPKGLLVTPLFDAAVAARRKDGGPSAAIVIAEESTPYRVVTEVLYTLGQAELGRYHMMVLRGAGPSDAGAGPPWPSLGRLVARAERATFLDLKVHIAHDGVTFRTADGPLGEGCKAGTPGVTVPKVGGRYDLAGVRRCAFQLKGAAMSATSLVLSAEQDVDYAIVIDVTDALREEDGQKLFPDVVFGPAK